jgi:hypothetical protein
MPQALNVPVGGLLMFTHGEFSDYCFEGHFIAMEALDETVFETVHRSILNQIKSGEIKDDEGREIDMNNRFAVGSATCDHFIPEMIRTGKIISIDCVEIYTGTYSIFDLSKGHQE